jgi:glycosyltransferase involved in cell wall biosynthesis
MRIVHIITRSDNVGGAQIHVRDLSVTALEQGHRVTVLTGGVGPFTEDLSEHGVPWVSIPRLARPIHPLNDWLAFGQIRKALRRLQPAVTSAHSSKAGLLGRLAAWSLGRPVIFTAHGWAFHPSLPRHQALLYRKVETLGAKFAKRIITVSEFDRQLALRSGVAPAHKLVTVHNGIPDVPVTLRAAADGMVPRLIMVARFEAPKDHRTLFQALAGLRDMPWELDLIGDGPLLGDAENQAAALGISERVRFWGSRKDVAERLAKSDVFLLLSDREGFPISILEAMRAGLPVVASAVGGIPEAVEDGVSGFLVPPRDPETLRDRIHRLLAEPALRRRLGDGGRRRYEQEFTLSHSFSKTLQVYKDALESSSDARALGGSPARVRNGSRTVE